jgi:hypothetical protein
MAIPRRCSRLLPLLLAIALHRAPLAAPTFLVPPERLQLLLIGSSEPSRRAYIDAAQASVARHFTTHIISDADVPGCNLCPMAAAEYHSGRYVLPAYNDAPFVSNSRGAPAPAAPRGTCCSGGSLACTGSSD